MDLDFLNSEQKKGVVTNSGPLLIMASAGSGKTRTVVTKMEYLLRIANIKPSRIWACTFTNKAAGEMRERLADSVGNKVADKVNLSTLHSLSYRIYKTGMKSKNPHFRVPKILHNEAIALGHLFKLLKKQNFRWKDANVYLKSISNLKLDLITTVQYKANAQINDLKLSTKKPYDYSWEESLYTIYCEYERWKKKNDYMDFQDMLVRCYYMLENPKYKIFREMLQDRCEYVIVDEAQDTNTVSFRILDIMVEKHRNVALVGDTRQLIYSFQGARMDNITRFMKKYNPEILDLSINYRSTETIVDNANTFISHARNIIGSPATTPNEKGLPIEYWQCADSSNESAYVGDLIENLIHGEEYKPKDIAILYRVHSQSVSMEDEMLMRQVPYITFHQNTFYERKEIRDLLNYIRVFINPKGMRKKLFKAIYQRPTRYISGKDVEDFYDFIDDYDYGVWEGIRNIHESDLNGKQKQKFDSLYASLHGGIARANKGATTEQLMRYVVDADGMGYEKYVYENVKEKDPDNDIQLNFDAIIDSAKKWPKPMDFIEYVEERDSRDEEKKDPNGDYVKLMSIHASKGKEFPVVIIVGACDRIYPFHRAVMEGNEAEEKRVMYVALTRPKERLYISAVNGQMGRNRVLASPYLGLMDINFNDKENFKDVHFVGEDYDGYKNKFFEALNKSLES